MQTSELSAAPAAPATVPLSVRVLRRLRPLVVALLGSPLHRLLSRDVLLLTYRGRRSGRVYTLPLSYVERDGRLYLCTQPRTSNWWRNLRDGDAVELRLRGRTVAARPAVLESGSGEAFEGFRAFMTRNPRTAALLYRVGAGRNGRPCEQDLRREVLGSVVVRLETAAG